MKLPSSRTTTSRQLPRGSTDAGPVKQFVQSEASRRRDLLSQEELDRGASQQRHDIRYFPVRLTVAFVYAKLEFRYYKVTDDDPHLVRTNSQTFCPNCLPTKRLLPVIEYHRTEDRTSLHWERQLVACTDCNKVSYLDKRWRPSKIFARE